MVNDIRLLAVRVKSEKDSVPFGSEEDEVAALKFLSILELDEQQLKETVVSHFTIKYANLSEVLILITLHDNFYTWHFFPRETIFIVKYQSLTRDTGEQPEKTSRN